VLGKELPNAELVCSLGSRIASQLWDGCFVGLAGLPRWTASYNPEQERGVVMSISELGTGEIPVVKSPPAAPAATRVALHCIAAVRQQQGISLRGLARQLRKSVAELEAEEDEATDLRLSRVYWWQRVLEVPIAELLIDSNSPLSAPVLERARLVRIMKTVAAIAEKSEGTSIKRLAQTLAEQLVELMPELEGVSPWHTVGQRRTLDELGRIAERPYSEDIWRDST
jgi:transcriptional regulator with XRE-family HTH domain